MTSLEQMIAAAVQQALAQTQTKTSAPLREETPESKIRRSLPTLDTLTRREMTSFVKVGEGKTGKDSSWSGISLGKWGRNTRAGLTGTPDMLVDFILHLERNRTEVWKYLVDLESHPHMREKFPEGFGIPDEIRAILK